MMQGVTICTDPLSLNLQCPAARCNTQKKTCMFQVESSTWKATRNSNRHRQPGARGSGGPGARACLRRASGYLSRARDGRRSAGGRLLAAGRRTLQLNAGTRPRPQCPGIASVGATVCLTRSSLSNDPLALGTPAARVTVTGRGRGGARAGPAGIKLFPGPSHRHSDGRGAGAGVVTSHSVQWIMITGSLSLAQGSL
jgi:hypothetical protein